MSVRKRSHLRYRLHNYRHNKEHLNEKSSAEAGPQKTIRPFVQKVSFHWTKNTGSTGRKTAAGWDSHQIMWTHRFICGHLQKMKRLNSRSEGRPGSPPSGRRHSSQVVVVTWPAAPLRDWYQWNDTDDDNRYHWGDSYAGKKKHLKQEILGSAVVFPVSSPPLPVVFCLPCLATSLGGITNMISYTCSLVSPATGPPDYIQLYLNLAWSPSHCQFSGYSKSTVCSTAASAQPAQLLVSSALFLDWPPSLNL